MIASEDIVVKESGQRKGRKTGRNMRDACNADRENVQKTGKTYKVPTLVAASPFIPSQDGRLPLPNLTSGFRRPIKDRKRNPIKHIVTTQRHLSLARAHACLFTRSHTSCFRHILTIRHTHSSFHSRSHSLVLISRALFMNESEMFRKIHICYTPPHPVIMFHRT